MKKWILSLMLLTPAAHADLISWQFQTGWSEGEDIDHPSLAIFADSYITFDTDARLITELGFKSAAFDYKIASPIGYTATPWDGVNGLLLDNTCTPCKLTSGQLLHLHQFEIYGTKTDPANFFDRVSPYWAVYDLDDLVTPAWSTFVYAINFERIDTAADIPEPSTLALLGLGLAGLVRLRRQQLPNLV